MNDETIRPELMNFGYEMKNLLGPSANVIAENSADGGVIIRVTWTTSIGAKYGYKRTYSWRDVEIIPLVLILSDLYREIDNYSKDKRSLPEVFIPSKNIFPPGDLTEIFRQTHLSIRRKKRKK